MIVIESRTGKDISNLSNYGPRAGGSELEVLLNAGTQFSVVPNTWRNGQHLIVMKEL